LALLAAFAAVAFVNSARPPDAAGQNTAERR
jgi:hypothetical protein